jgi:hypothetical protein
MIRCPEETRVVFENMTGEIVDYRLSQYAQSRKLQSNDEGSEFVAKVSQPDTGPILFLPDKDECPGRPVGPIAATLPAGSIWVFHLVKLACNVADPKGDYREQTW